MAYHKTNSGPVQKCLLGKRIWWMSGLRPNIEVRRHNPHPEFQHQLRWGEITSSITFIRQTRDVPKATDAEATAFKNLSVDEAMIQVGCYLGSCTWPRNPWNGGWSCGFCATQTLVTASHSTCTAAAIVTTSRWTSALATGLPWAWCPTTSTTLFV